MDYKFIILLVLLFGLILFLTKEFSNIYRKMDENNDRLSSSIDTNFDIVKKQVRNDLGVCLSKVKTFNADCIQKIRRMDMLGSQPVTHISNYCTDADSELGSKDINIIPCLSDVINAKQNTIKLPTEELFLSDDQPQNKDKNSKINSDKFITNKTNSDKFVVNYESKSNSLQKNDNKFNDSLNINENELIAKVTELVNKETFQNESSHNSHKKSQISKISSKQSPDDNNSYSSNSQQSSKSSKSSHSTSSRKTSSISIKSSDHVSESESSQQSTSDGVPVIFDKQSNNSKKDNKKETNENSVIDYDNCNITIGSKKSKKGINPNQKIIQSKKDNSSDEHNVEEISVKTSDVNMLTLDNLKQLNDYTIESLKKIAKLHSIPLTLRDDGQRRNLKKGELYNKIKGLLSKKENNKTK